MWGRNFDFLLKYLSLSNFMRCSHPPRTTELSPFWFFFFWSSLKLAAQFSFFSYFRLNLTESNSKFEKGFQQLLLTSPLSNYFFLQTVRTKYVNTSAVVFYLIQLFLLAISEIARLVSIRLLSKIMQSSSWRISKQYTFMI